VAGLVLLFAPVLVAIGITAIERLDRAAERRLLDLQASQLALQALAPGSPLACLDGATEALGSWCEKALFSTPQATTAAISYVAMQISLLGAAKSHNEPRTPAGVLANFQRAVEADRFGFVAYVLASSYGCSAQSCDRLGLLHDPRRVKSNLADGLFATTLRKYIEESNKAAELVPRSAQAPTLTAGCSAKPSMNLYIPSAASIPPVSIMTAEPKERKEASEATIPNAPQSRKAPPAKESKAGGTVNSRATHGTPLQLSPGAQ
jgi:hypothetical protein